MMNTTVSNWTTEEKQAVLDFILNKYADLNPLKVAIVGSFAWGSPHEGSDLDIVVYVSNDDTPPAAKDGFDKDGQWWVVGVEKLSGFLRPWSKTLLNLGVYDLTEDTYHLGDPEDEQLWREVKNNRASLLPVTPDN